MTTGDLFIIYVIAGALAIICCFWLTAHLRYKDGFNDGRDYERNRRNTRAIEDRRRPPTRLIGPARWEMPYAGQHAPWTPCLTVTRSATIAFDGSPSTIPINARSDSGELRALIERSDRYIEDMRRQAAADRRQLAIR